MQILLIMGFCSAAKAMELLINVSNGYKCIWGTHKWPEIDFLIKKITLIADNFKVWISRLKSKFNVNIDVDYLTIEIFQKE